MRLVELSNKVASVSSSLKEKDFLELLKTKYKNSYDAARKQPIFGKLISKEDFLLINPSTSSRQSKFIIDGLTAHLNSWRNYADRTECVRGWTDQEIADNRGEGSVYLLIPIDHAHVYVAAGDNFYRSFAKANKFLEVERLDNGALFSWYESLWKVAKAVKLVSGNIPDFETSKQFLKALEQLDKLHTKTKEISELENLEAIDLRRIESVLKLRKPLKDILSIILDPDDNGIKSFSTLYNLTPNKEVWTSAKCIAVLYTEYEALYNRGIVK